MTLLCTITGHVAASEHRRNQGLEFSQCHHCGCDLIRTEHGDWTQVPRGMRVVWREAARFGDSAAVADRMHRMARTPRRRVPRNGPIEVRRDPRGGAWDGATAMLSMLAHLGRVVSPEAIEEPIRAPRQKPIQLPEVRH